MRNLVYRLLVRVLNARSLVRGALRMLIAKSNFGSFEFRMAVGVLERPHYAYICYNAANLAKRLGHAKISVLEYGVARGDGLLVLEKYAAEIEKLLQVGIEIYGFDTGAGLPPPRDYRDLPYIWKEGFFSMDEAALRPRLKRSVLVLGNIESTSKDFFDRYHPAPIGAVIHDFDFYSSTKTALKMFNADSEHYLPRVYCYFDDTIGTEFSLYNDFTGERLAINEFNSESTDIKLAVPYHLRLQPFAGWHDQIWICHLFRHAEYCKFIGA